MSANNGNTLLWSISDDWGDVWWPASVNMTASSQYFVLVEGVVGDSFTSDMAIDDVSVIEESCHTPGDV